MKNNEQHSLRETARLNNLLADAELFFSRILCAKGGGCTGTLSDCGMRDGSRWNRADEGEKKKEIGDECEVLFVWIVSKMMNTGEANCTLI